MSRNKLTDTLKCILAGCLAGTANGLFGAGGGLVLVPFFIRILHMDASLALPTSIGIILPLSIVSAFTYKTGVEFQTLLPFLIGGLIGGAVGGYTFRYIPTLKLRRILGVLIIYSGVRAVLQLF